MRIFLKIALIAKKTGESDLHHIPVERSKTIRSLSVVISLYLNAWDDFHCVKSGRIRSFSGPYFPAFGLHTERYRVKNVQMRENMDQKKSEYGHFSRSVSSCSEPVSMSVPL